MFALLLCMLGCSQESVQPLAPPGRPSPHAPAPTPVPSHRQLIDETIQQQHANIAECYQRQLKRRRTISGRLSVRFVIAEDGTVTDVSAKEDTLNVPKVTDCVLDIVEGLVFPAGMKTDIVKPRGPFEEEETGLEVVYPFVFAQD